MAKNKSVNDFISKLKCSSITYDDLLKIKSNVVNTREGTKLLMQNNIMKDLVNLLDKPNEKILDMTLSILGNCCLDENCRKEVVSFGVVKKLSNVLHNIVKDSIQCRACRLVGNLAQDFKVAEDLMQENIVIDIVSLLDISSKNSTATKQMGVRALRMLWYVEDQRIHMLKLKAVRAVSLLLNSDMKKPEERELLKAIIKALLSFSIDHSVQCAEQICGEGSIFKTLVTLTSDASLKKSALMIICNLCYMKNARPGLGSAGAVQLIISELKNREESNLGLFTEMVRSLCFFCNESVNRAAIRYGGGLPLMLEIVRTSSRTSINPYVLQALAQFMYDDFSLQELSEEGLVPVLVEKIASFVNDHGKKHHFVVVKEGSLIDEITEAYSRESCSRSRMRDRNGNNEKEEKEMCRQRFRANSPSYQEVVREQGSSSRCSFLHGAMCELDSLIGKQCFSLDYIYPGGDWSPGSPNSICGSPDASPSRRVYVGFSPSNSSSGLSPDTSPNARLHDGFDFPEAYSPVCSDQEDENDVNVESRIECDEIIVEDDEEDEFVPVDSEKNENLVIDYKQEHSTLSPALVLLSRLSCMDSPMEELASKSTLNALLDYITLIENPEPRAQRILLRIIRNHHYFTSIVQNKFILTIQTKLFHSPHHHCRKCIYFKNLGLQLYSDIRTLAQSGFGEGVLAHQLLKAEPSVKSILAISVPYIVKIQRLLVKLLLDCGGLKTLIDILKTDIKDDDDLINHIAMSLRLLGSSLQIPRSSNDAKDMDMYEFNEEYPENVEIEMPPITKINTLSDDMIFLLLDDGNAVKVSKSYLSLQSPVFEAMFRGDFKESQEERVPLPGISQDCLINLFRIMRHGRVPELMPGMDLNVSLELVAMLDRFLIPGSEDISKMIIERFLTMRTALDIYTRCIEAGDVLHFHKLRHETVKFIIMSGEMTTEIKKLYKDILKNPYKLQMLTDITDILEERLR